MVITKFEYTSVVEVDPVDVWAIIGAIGGVWRKYTVRTKIEEMRQDWVRGDKS